MLAPCVWFWHSVCDLNNHACDLNSHACDFDTLRFKLLYYNIYINLRCKHIPAAVRKLSPVCVSNQHSARHCNRTILHVDLTHIREDSTCMRAPHACWFDTNAKCVNNNKLCALNQHAAWLTVPYCVSIQQAKFFLFRHALRPTESTRKFLLYITINLWIYAYFSFNRIFLNKILIFNQETW
jgi:hypothetical protein